MLHLMSKAEAPHTAIVWPGLWYHPETFKPLQPDGWFQSIPSIQSQSLRHGVNFNANKLDHLGEKTHPDPMQNGRCVSFTKIHH